MCVSVYRALVKVLSRNLGLHQNFHTTPQSCGGAAQTSESRLMRLFAVIGLPVSSLISYLRPAHPMSDYIATQVHTRMAEPKAGPSEVAKAEYSVSEKSEGPGGHVLSDSATEVSSSDGGCKTWRPSRAFNVPGGPFLLLAHTGFSKNVYGTTIAPQATQNLTLLGLIIPHSNQA